MSGPEVIGAISSVIAIIDASIKVYDSAHKDLKLSETLKIVRSRLPILLDILNTCESQLQLVEGPLPLAAAKGLQNILTRCDEKVEDLKTIFDKVLTGPADTWQQRYVKIAKRLGKGSKVEELMLCITEDIQLVVNHHAVKSARPDQVQDLEKIINEMKSVQSSPDEEEGSGMVFNSQGGAMTNMVNRGSGNFIHNNAPVTTQNFGKT